jgi:hypothetical protein
MNLDNVDVWGCLRHETVQVVSHNETGFYFYLHVLMNDLR